MAGSRKLGRLLDHAAACRAKVVLVGDAKQLSSVDAGGGFRDLPLENRRQVQQWERDTLRDLREGRVWLAMTAYAEHGRLHIGDREELVRSMVDDWWDARATAAGDPAAGELLERERPAPAWRSPTAGPSTRRRAPPTGPRASRWQATTPTTHDRRLLLGGETREREALQRWQAAATRYRLRQRRQEWARRTSATEDPSLCPAEEGDVGRWPSEADAADPPHSRAIVASETRSATGAFSDM